MSCSEYDENLSRLAGNHCRTPPPQQMRQPTLTQMDRAGQLAPPVVDVEAPRPPRKDPLPPRSQLPDGVIAFRDDMTGKVLFKAYDDETGSVYVEQTVAALQVKRGGRSEVRNLSLSQMSDLTETAPSQPSGTLAGMTQHSSASNDSTVDGDSPCEDTPTNETPTNE